MTGNRSILSVAFVAAGVLLGVGSILNGLFTSQEMGRFSWSIAAIFMGKIVVQWPSVFDFGAISAAWTALWIISIGYVAVLARLILPWNGNRPLLAGAVWGLCCCLPSFYGFTAFFPWLADERTWATWVSHGVFGLVAAWLFTRKPRSYQRNIFKSTRQSQ